MYGGYPSVRPSLSPAPGVAIPGRWGADLDSPLLSVGVWSLPGRLLELDPWDLAKLLEGRELAVAELDRGGADETGLHAQVAADLVVDLCAGVVAHGEVVAALVALLMEGGGAGQHEDAPVLDVADDAAVAEDELAGGEDNPRRSRLSAVAGAAGEGEGEGEDRERERDGEGEDGLLDFGNLARADLRCDS